LNKYRKVFNNLKSTEGTLSQKVVRSGFWVFFLRMINRGFSFIRLIILARILSPSDFGLMGIALLTISILETFTQTGFQSALIQKKEDIQPYLDTAWTFLILRGIILFIILYLIAPFVAFFFDTPKAGPIIRAIGVVLIFNALTNIGIIYFQKELTFYKEFIYQFSGTIVNFIVALVAVLILKNVWALVYGTIAGSIVGFIVSYFVHPYRPKISFDFVKTKELFGFGKWIMSSSILVFLLTHGDDIFVGKFLGATALGFYQLAYRISNMPATEYSHVIAAVTFPAYSKIQDNFPKLRDTYLKVLQLTAFLSIPIAGGIFILAPDFTRIFLGMKWMPMVPAMQVLALYGMLRAIGATTGALFMAIGKPEISTKIKFSQLILLVILIYPLTVRWGILGTSIAVTAYALVFNFFAVFKVLNLVQSDYKKPVKLVIYPLISTLIMTLTIFTLRNYVFQNIDIIDFLFFVLIGISVYLALVYLFDTFFDYKGKKLIQEQFINIFQKPKKHFYTKEAKRYEHLYKIIKKNKCRRIMEIGVWNGNHAIKMIEEAKKTWKSEDIEYYGFDLFEDLNEKMLKEEFSKKPPLLIEVKEKLKKTGAIINLYKGNTLKTLPEVIHKIPNMDFIFIDGGHSLKTICNDWKYSMQLMHNKTVVIFDDYYNREDIGCKKIVESINKKVFYVKVLEPTEEFKKDWGILHINFVKVVKKTEIDSNIN